MVKLQSLSICLLFSVLLSGQPNYIPYHQKMIDIESLIIKEAFVAAEQEILDLFIDYKPICGYDFLLAAQLCALNKHDYLSLEFLEKALEKGIEVDYLKGLKVFESLLKLEKWKRIEGRLGRLQYNYLASINLDLSKEFEKRFKAEQAAKGTDRYRQVIQDNFNRIREVISQYGFPGEDLIGINTDHVIITLYAHPYSFSILQKELLAALENGKLHPADFLKIYNWEARRISLAYLDKAPPNGITLPEYNIVGLPDSDPETLKKERYKFGIRSLDFNKQKAVSQKYGIRF